MTVCGKPPLPLGPALPSGVTQFRNFGSVRLKRPPVDFVLLISSLSSVLGGLRFSAYASANAFLDAFAAWRQRTTTARWLSINWDTWLRAEDEERARRSGTAVPLEEADDRLEGM